MHSNDYGCLSFVLLIGLFVSCQRGSDNKRAIERTNSDIKELRQDMERETKEINDKLDQISDNLHDLKTRVIINE